MRLASAVGLNDQHRATFLFADPFSSRMTSLLQDLGVDIPVAIVPGMKHADMIARPEALQVVVRAICRQN